MVKAKGQIMEITEPMKAFFTAAYCLGNAAASMVAAVMVLVFIALPAGLFSLACVAAALDALFGTHLLGLLG